MAWEIRNQKQYFYLSRRLPNGRIRKEYFGRGLMAELESDRLQTQAEIRRQIRVESQLITAAESLLQQQVRSTTDLVHALMISVGFTNVRSRGWRPIPMIARQEIEKEAIGSEAPEPHDEMQFIELARAARRGDRSVIPALRRRLVANRELAPTYGNLASRTQIRWIDLIAGPDLFFRECLLQDTAQLKKDLFAETGQTVVERMLVEQAISTWLQLYYHENLEATSPAGNLQLGQYRLKKIESAFSRHMKSLGGLAGLKAINFSQRMADKMKGLLPPETAEEPLAAASLEGDPAGGNRLREAFSRNVESVPLN